MFFHFINCKNFHLNVFWVSSIIQINKLLFLLSLSLLFWLHDQQIYLQKTEAFSEDDDQPKLRGSGVVVTLVCEYTRDPEGI